jgi:hypothetical protein
METTEEGVPVAAAQAGAFGRVMLGGELLRLA